MLLVHCVIHRENSVLKNITPVLNEVLRANIKCINAIKANAKCEHFFKQFCENENADYVKLLLHTEVSWL